MTPSTSVILIDDETEVLRAYAQGLTLAGFTVTAFPRAELALVSLSDAFDGAVVCDVRMPGMDGLELFRRVQALDPDIPVILISGHADIATAVGAVHQGAYDFLSKPFFPEALAQRVRCALEQRRLALENRLLRRRVEDPQTHSPLIGMSPAITALRRMITQIAET
jgi:two-component system, NtrC family, C4-dicarboxylate transport response regulator DctD